LFSTNLSEFPLVAGDPNGCPRQYCWLVAAGWFVLREKYYWLVVDKPSEQGGDLVDKPSEQGGGHRPDAVDEFDLSGRYARLGLAYGVEEFHL
jgi:hypothetical protein